MLEVSKRIEKLADCVKYDKVADIATDHCYIPIHLSKVKTVKKIIACDINEKPLQNGQQHIKDYSLEKIIETRLGDGLSPIEVGEVDTIIIAGIGGSLMCKILQDSLEVVKSAKQLVLQPQSDLIGLRKYLISIGFKIDNEFVVDENRLYTILDCSIGYDEYTKEQFILGKNTICDEPYKKYLKYNINALEKIKQQLLNADENKYEIKITELEEEQNIYKEKLKCL